MKEMLLQELVHLAIIVKLGAALLNMLDPALTCVLDFMRKALFNLPSLHISYKHARSTSATDVLSERYQHEPYTAVY